MCWSDFGRITAPGSSQALGAWMCAAPLWALLMGILLGSSQDPGGL